MNGIGHALEEIVYGCRKRRIAVRNRAVLGNQFTWFEESLDGFPGRNNAVLQLLYGSSEIQVGEAVEEPKHIVEQVNEDVRHRGHQFLHNTEACFNHIYYNFDDIEDSTQGTAEFADPAAFILGRPEPFPEPVHQIPESGRNLLQPLAGHFPEYVRPGLLESGPDVLQGIHGSVNSLDQVFPAVNGAFDSFPFLGFLVVMGKAPPLPQDGIPLLRGSVQHGADLVINGAPEFSCFQHVAEDELHGVCPAALDGFRHGVPHLLESTYLRGGLGGFLADFHQVIDLVVFKSPGLENVRVAHLAGINLENPQHRFLVQPSVAQAVTEIFRADFNPLVPRKLLAVLVHGDEELLHLLAVGHLGDFLGQLSGGFRRVDKQLFQFRSGQVGIFDRLPVNGRHLADAQRLGEVVHGHAGLLCALACLRRHVGDTLHGGH